MREKEQLRYRDSWVEKRVKGHNDVKQSRNTEREIETDTQNDEQIY